MKKTLFVLGLAMLFQSQDTVSAQFFKNLKKAWNEVKVDKEEFHKKHNPYYKSSASSSTTTQTSQTSQTQQAPAKAEPKADYDQKDYIFKMSFVLAEHINPAIKMTEEERLAKYNEMKANDKFELVDGCFAKIHKVLPNLITFDYEQDVKKSKIKNLGILRFTTLNGDVLTINWEEPYGTNEEYRHEKLKNLYSGKVRTNTPINPKSDIWDMSYVYLSNGRYEPISFTCANGDEMIVKGMGVGSHEIRPLIVKIANPGGDYVGYSYHDNSYVPTGVCKTLEDCTIEIIGKIAHSGDNKVYRIVYPNGDIYEGSLSTNVTYKRYIFDDIKQVALHEGGQTDMYTAATMHICKAKTLSDIGTLLNGMITSRDNSVKIYVNGEYDEIESITYTQRIQAEERKKKEAAEALVKQRATLTQKYGKQYVDIFYRPSAKMTDLIIVGMPVGLLMEFHDSGKLAIDIKMKQSNGNSTCYEIYGYPAFGGNYKKFGYFWAKNGRITSFNLYGMN